MSRFSNHSLKIHSLAESATTLGLINSAGHQLNSEIGTPEHGDPYSIAQAILMQRPQIPFGTHALASLIDLVSLTGKAISPDGSHPGVVLYAQKHDANGTNGRASSGHMSATYANGQLMINEISGSTGGFATLQGCMHGIATAASTAPYTVAFNATLPSTKVENELYGIGKPTVLGVQVSRVRSVSVNYNPTIELSDDADSIWPTLVDIQKIGCLTRIVTEDPTWLDAASRISPLGDRAVHADTWVYFLKHALADVPVSGGKFLSFASEVHIKGLLCGLVHVSEPYQAAGSGISSTTIEIVGEKTSGGAAPISWDTTAAYA